MNSHCWIMVTGLISRNFSFLKNQFVSSRTVIIQFEMRWDKTQVRQAPFLSFWIFEFLPKTFKCFIRYDEFRGEWNNRKLPQSCGVRSFSIHTHSQLENKEVFRLMSLITINFVIIIFCRMHVRIMLVT